MVRNVAILGGGTCLYAECTADPEASWCGAAAPAASAVYYVATQMLERSMIEVDCPRAGRGLGRGGPAIYEGADACMGWSAVKTAVRAILYGRGLSQR